MVQRDISALEWERILIQREVSKREQLQDLARITARLGCVHNWVYDGHGHNYDDYRCTKCGTIEER